MKTLEKIKKGLRICAETSFCDEDCPYYDDCNDGKSSFADDALACIRRLERERDAAVKILTDIAHHTDWFGGVDVCAVCKKDKCKECVSANEGFEWRGVPGKEDDHEADSD